MSLPQTLSVPVAFVLVLHLAGCDRPPAAPDRAAPRVAVGEPQVEPTSEPLAHPTQAPAIPAPSALPDAVPTGQFPAQPPPDLVLHSWASAIEARDWAKVRSLWGDKGADSGLSPHAFASQWGRLRHPRVKIGPGEQEGAAGSLYYTAPVTITDGGRTVGGQVTIRRVNDVDGAAPEQLRWHLDATTRAPWTTLR